MAIKVSKKEDFDKLMELLSEYTDKLRKICEEREEYRNRRSQNLVMYLLVIMMFTVLLLFFINFGRYYINLFDEPFIFLLGAVGLFAVIFVLSRDLIASRKTISFDAEQVAATVERLINTSSQYSEHANSQIGNKFEFDLRVAEAEASLRVYYNLFR